MSSFVVLRLGVTYRLQSDIVRLQARLDAHESEMEPVRKDVLARLDELEKTLFGEVQPLAQANAKKPTQPLSRLETWMMNSNKELRTEIDALKRQIRELR